jgi:hypothetical protein
VMAFAVTLFAMVLLFFGFMLLAGVFDKWLDKKGWLTGKSKRKRRQEGE